MYIEKKKEGLEITEEKKNDSCCPFTSFIKKVMGTLDKKLEEKSKKKSSCCCSSKNEEDKGCCG